MSVSVVVGALFGDESKAKIVDYLCESYDIGVRYNGSSNAGHTVVTGGKKYVSHLLPVSALHKHMVSVISAGVSIDLDVLKEDIKAFGFDSSRLLVDKRCPVITHKHKIEDSGANSRKIGTTKRGVGPCMADQTNRVGERIGSVAGIKSCDARSFLYRSIKRGKNVLFEGAQGTFLDLWYGSYPFVTSSPTTVGAVCTNSGIPPKLITDVYGVFKPYTTRVGEGPFLTENDDKTAAVLRKAGNEYGATTGRPRRTGWLDLVDLKTSCEINGIDWLCLAKVDIMPEELGSFLVAVDRDKEGNPIYEDVPCWGPEAGEASTYWKLPDNLKRFVSMVEKRVGVPVSIISNGPGREKTIRV